jgi:putative transposase
LDDKSAVVKEYKEEIETLKKEKGAMAKKLGEVIVERDCPRTLSCGLVA